MSDYECDNDNHAIGCQCPGVKRPSLVTAPEEEHGTDWFCDTAKGIIGNGGQRKQDYGSALESFEKIAKLWSVILDVEVSAEQVALCMAMVKMGRLRNTPNHTDSWIDIIGYAALGGQIAHTPGRYV